MSGSVLTEADVQNLAMLGNILIPATETMPAAAAVAGFAGALRVAAKSCGYDEAAIRIALGLIGPEIDWAAAELLEQTEPAAFAILGTLVSAAYYMTPQVLALLKFPTDRQHPAAMEEFVSEYETGVLDVVTERGPRYRDVAAA